MKLIVFLALMLFSVNSFAYSSVQILEFSMEEIIYATALPTATTDLAVNVLSSNAQKKQASELQNEIQIYFNSNEIGPLLLSKINLVLSLDENLAINECVDLLSNATKSILEK